MSNQKLLLPFKWKQSVASWLEEDCPSFDYGGYVVGDQVTVATLWMKDSGVIAGVPFFNEGMLLFDKSRLSISPIALFRRMVVS
jgi:nicotinate-nucleotide pyrophosphorylase